jgi:hypothetical protein
MVWSFSGVRQCVRRHLRSPDRSGRDPRREQSDAWVMTFWEARLRFHLHRWRAWNVWRGADRGSAGLPNPQFDTDRPSAGHWLLRCIRSWGHGHGGPTHRHRGGHCQLVRACYFGPFGEVIRATGAPITVPGCRQGELSPNFGDDLRFRRRRFRIERMPDWQRLQSHR